jgi:sterol desaturase/sphingolipid hydroxylase (fatty acid hydroxylase superfamily)
METLASLLHRLPPLASEAIRLTNGLILLAVLLVPLERVFALRPQKTLREGFASDIGYYFLSSLLPNRMLALPIALLAFGLQRLGLLPFHMWVSGLPLGLRFAASMLVAEIGFYWGHRWMHQSALLWRFHAVHHSPSRMDWLVNTHAHPVDLVFIRLCGYVPLYLVGLARVAGNRIDWAPLLVALVGSMWGYFIHANLRFRFGWIEHIVATPAFHHWHHDKAGSSQGHTNYAPMLPWVDHLFGTFHRDRTNWPASYGIAEKTADGLFAQLRQPFLDLAPREEGRL